MRWLSVGPLASRAPPVGEAGFLMPKGEKAESLSRMASAFPRLRGSTTEGPHLYTFSSGSKKQ